MCRTPPIMRVTLGDLAPGPTLLDLILFFPPPFLSRGLILSAKAIRGRHCGTGQAMEMGAMEPCSAQWSVLRRKSTDAATDGAIVTPNSPIPEGKSHNTMNQDKHKPKAREATTMPRTALVVPTQRGQVQNDPVTNVRSVASVALAQCKCRPTSRQAIPTRIAPSESGQPPSREATRPLLGDTTPKRASVKAESSAPFFGRDKHPRPRCRKRRQQASPH